MLRWGTGKRSHSSRVCVHGHRRADADQGSHEWRGFLAYIKQCLVPTLKRKDIVVADNVPFHKVAGVEEAIQLAGASLRYLPQYLQTLIP